MTTSAVLLLEARKRAGLSRRALAARAGTPISTVSRIEEEQSDPTLPMLERLLAAAGSRLVVEAHPYGDHPTIAELATAVDRDNERLKIDWTRLRGFADWAERHPGELADAMASPPARTSTPLDAVLAAFAEELATRHGIDRPRWTRAVGPLPAPWSPPTTPRMRAAAAASTSEPFQRRNLVLADTALFRSTE
jgi:transcriptional regulator with XRE-family HTH domain